MTIVQEIQEKLRSAATTTPEHVARFFKIYPGSYGAHDKFLGVTVPQVRCIAKQYVCIDLVAIIDLLRSEYNEERLCALIILVMQYQQGNFTQKEAIYQFYLAHKNAVNNWNLVDSSAHLIVGAHLLHKDRAILCKLAESNNLWDRRIAIVATWYFIRQSDLTSTFVIAKILLHDQHDLIHKAVGWMLREAGKKNEKILIEFLDEYAQHMPRTMLRYALEKLDQNQRKKYVMKS